MKQEKAQYQKIRDLMHAPLAELHKRYQGITGCQRGLLKEMHEYIVLRPGKHLRGILVFLSGGIDSSTQYDAMCNAALAIELLHTATLIHDDINDNAQMRRGIKTCHQEYGIKNSILFGDYLFAQSFMTLSQCKRSDILANLSHTITEICAGEILQNQERNNFRLSFETYMSIIRKKTATLIGESCRTGALLGKTPEQSKSFYEFGIDLGIAFQIHDDYLDFTGKERELGKTPFSDIQNGHSTLPIIYLFEAHHDAEELIRLLEGIQSKKTPAKIARLQTLLNEHDCLKRTIETVETYQVQALEKMHIIEDQATREKFQAITEYIKTREV